jgi:tetratricopeptide (TPR) repeat protein
MTRTILTVALVILLNVLAGCASIDSGRAQLVATGAKQSTKTAAVKVAGAGETDIVEQMAVNRQAYRQGLELLTKHYTKTGNNMKLLWAKKELAALDAMPQYNYIIEAGVAGPDLKASTSISEADDLYKEALELEKKAGPLPLLKNEELLRLALDKYNQLIRKHPSSDKIDDAAYGAGLIYEYFRDYTIALLYYQRTYQWDPDTSYPAMFKAAFVLDKRLHRRDEALELYRQAVKAIKREGEHQEWKEFAEKRIREFTESGE